jgi:hypothetical protein
MKFFLLRYLRISRDTPRHLQREVYFDDLHRRRFAGTGNSGILGEWDAKKVRHKQDFFATLADTCASYNML